MIDLPIQRTRPIDRGRLGRAAIVGALALLLAACAGRPATKPTSPIADDPYAEFAAAELRKSPNDHREYRTLTLPNRLRVLLISDAKADKAAASMVVARGSFHDPDEYAGLAHFLEHMLFIGTEKYPEVDAYQQFIGKNGGSSNAYTALDHTNYFFDIKPEQFQEGLDRFAQFFINPLLAAEYVDREKNAIQSEYQLQTKDAGWRGYAVSKLTLNPDHPGSRFTIGSLDTLGDGVRGALRAWFEGNYSADQMFLVAVSNEALDDLEQWVVPMFLGVPDRNIGPPPEMPPMFRDGDLPATLVRETLKDRYTLDFQFSVPALAPHFRTKPGVYISNLLGHEGAGSLHQWLKGKGWIQSLSASSDDFDSTSGQLVVSLELTPEGRAKVPEITRALFQTIELIKARGPDRALFDEQAQLLDLAFKFQESAPATRIAYGLGPMFLQLPPAHVLDAGYRMDQFDPALIETYLGYLTPDNLMVEIAGPDVETDAIEPWFEVPYALTRGPVAVAADSVAEGLALPDTNPFIPERTDLVANATDTVPALVIDEAGIQLWAAADTEFGTPKANVQLTLGLDGGLTEARDLVLARLYAALVNDALEEFAYPAYLAGVSYQLSASAAGFDLRLAGYDDKQVVLLERVLERFATLDIDADRFDVYRDQYERSWRSFETEKPYTQTLTALGNLVQASSFPPATLADMAATLTAADLERWVAQRRSSMTVRGLLHGNVRDDRAPAIAQVLRDTIDPVKGAIYRPTIYSPQEASRLALTIDHPDASMILYLQDEDSAIESRAQSALATHLLRQAYFTELRTKDQLGYVVGMSNRTYQDRGGIAFIVQSPVADPKALMERTYRFLDSQIGVVANLDAQAFADYKAGLMAEILESPKNLSDRTGRFWIDLKLDRLTFDGRQTLAAAIGEIAQDAAVAHMRAIRSALPERQVLVYNTGKFDVAPTVGKLLPGFDALQAGVTERGTAVPPATGYSTVTR
ncbi:MAG: insulinase family protein [Pseudomonadota bacterium]